MNQLCLLTIKMNSERLKNFKEDEDHVKNDGKDSDDDDDADPYGDEEFDDDYIVPKTDVKKKVPEKKFDVSFSDDEDNEVF